MMLHTYFVTFFLSLLCYYSTSDSFKPWYSRSSYSDEVYQRQQRLLSTSSENYLKTSRNFSTSTNCQMSFFQTPYLLKRFRIYRNLYNFRAMVDPSFNEADFLEGCKSVSTEYNTMQKTWHFAIFPYWYSISMEFVKYFEVLALNRGRWGSLVESE